MIADVVSIMTGIPLSKVAESENQRLLHLNRELSDYIVGQNEAIQSIVNAIRRSRTGVKKPKSAHRCISLFGANRSWKD